VIDRADWLDIRQRTEDEIGGARRDYDRLAGSATVMGDIPPSERVRDAWDSWSTGPRRHPRRAGPRPDQAASRRRQRQRRGQQQEHGPARERELAVLRQRVEFDWRV